MAPLCKANLTLGFVLKSYNIMLATVLVAFEEMSFWTNVTVPWKGFFVEVVKMKF